MLLGFGCYDYVIRLKNDQHGVLCSASGRLYDSRSAGVNEVRVAR